MHDKKLGAKVVMRLAANDTAESCNHHHYTSMEMHEIYSWPSFYFILWEMHINCKWWLGHAVELLDALHCIPVSSLIHPFQCNRLGMTDNKKRKK